jgi:hypothetical protein
MILNNNLINGQGLYKLTITRDTTAASSIASTDNIYFDINKYSF